MGIKHNELMKMNLMEFNIAIEEALNNKKIQAEVDELQRYNNAVAYNLAMWSPDKLKDILPVKFGGTKKKETIDDVFDRLFNIAEEEE